MHISYKHQDPIGKYLFSFSFDFYYITQAAFTETRNLRIWKCTFKKPPKGFSFKKKSMDIFGGIWYDDSNSTKDQYDKWTGGKSNGRTEQRKNTAGIGRRLWGCAPLSEVPEHRSRSDRVCGYRYASVLSLQLMWVWVDAGAIKQWNQLVFLHLSKKKNAWFKNQIKRLFWQGKKASNGQIPTFWSQKCLIILIIAVSVYILSNHYFPFIVLVVAVGVNVTLSSVQIRNAEKALAYCRKIIRAKRRQTGFGAAF